MTHRATGPRLFKGIIYAVEHTPGSGIATVVLEDGDGIRRVHVDAGPFFRAVAEIGAVFGSEITYELTPYGTMSSFSIQKG